MSWSCSTKSILCDLRISDCYAYNLVSEPDHRSLKETPKNPPVEEDLVAPWQHLVIPIRDGGSITYQRPLLSATNYTSWAIKMESFIDAQGIWDAIEPPTDVEVDLKIRKKARAFIFQALPEEILLQVAGHKEAKDVWDALKVRYLGADRVQQARIQNLNREFELLAMKDGDTIDDFAGKIGEVTSKFRTLGITMEEKTKVKKLLGAAPDRFLPIVAVIEQFSDLNVMMFEELVGRLKAYEERVKPAASSTSQPGKLLLTKEEWQEKQKTELKQGGRGRGSGRGAGPNKFNSFGRGRGRSNNSRGRGGGRSSNGDRWSNRGQQQNNKQQDRTERRCYNCDRPGHLASDCWAQRNRMRKPT
ncbi:hypothetical protein E3N88_03771 [Mikania micrantha]|uniref:CCHC-type domain-containing protein n=1 Tax=Mikania micrantha TaxID=192012 RepID=A0A5N6PTG0_9ASTR|nr:hypothetical protein E3N88_03771 [Mikania micrantha]